MNIQHIFFNFLVNKRPALVVPDTQKENDWHYCKMCSVGFNSNVRYYWHLNLCKNKSDQA
ncbi:hypothetical protein K501DRAFT_283726 [Backusella circina FSU 941]|nr:hypothetical protein K501DRAFT_283726 [Backusella circina FSU 941]